MTQQALKHSWYIVVEGAIGVGKTTLARMLRDHFGTGLVLEVFEENPFLARFYESRAQYAFQTQMFFLLSRYRQQQQVPRLLEQGALISDYMFSKDWLFARLNLAGDEWETYQQIQAALAGQVVPPDLIVYLQADTDVLMGRISLRDRPYERTMDRDYIEALRQAYDLYFASHQDIPVLYIDTNHLNFVSNADDFQFIVERIRSALREGMFQPTLPDFRTPVGQRPPREAGRPLSEYQRLRVELDKSSRSSTDLYFNYLCLSEEMGELSKALTSLWREELTLLTTGQPEPLARQIALSKWKQDVESELADCMTCLLRLANQAGIDLESAYLQKQESHALSHSKEYEP